MSAPRSRRRRVRQIIIFLSNFAVIDLDNNIDFGDAEVLSEYAMRLRPLDHIDDTELTSEQTDVWDYFDSVIGPECDCDPPDFNGMPTAFDNLLKDANL